MNGVLRSYVEWDGYSEVVWIAKSVYIVLLADCEDLRRKMSNVRPWSCEDLQKKMSNVRPWIWDDLQKKIANDMEPMYVELAIN